MDKFIRWCMLTVPGSVCYFAVIVGFWWWLAAVNDSGWYTVGAVVFSLLGVGFVGYNIIQKAAQR